MSNRQKLNPPPAVRSYAKHARCTDCDSTTERPRVDEYGLWHVTIQHDDGCPVLNGHVSTAEMASNTVRAIARDGHRAVAVMTGPEGTGVIHRFTDLIHHSQRLTQRVTEEETRE